MRYLQKKKLLFVINSLAGGGAERVVVNLINYFKDKYEIQLILLIDKRDYIYDLDSSIRVVCLGKKRGTDFFKAILKFRKELKTYSPDVVLSFVYFVNITTVIASLFLRRNFKLILSERNYPRRYLLADRLGLLRKWLMIATYQRADKIISVTESIEMVLKKEFYISSKKLKTIYNPILIEKIIIESKGDLTCSFFKANNSQVIISAGRLTAQKRFDRLLRVFSILRKLMDNVYLIILGEGELREDLEGLAVELRINNEVYFAGFKSNPYKWIAKSDIFVMSSDFEGFPNVLTEAMACGVPVISTNCTSGPAEIISNDKNGILVPTEDEERLAEAMQRLLKNEDLRRKFSEEGRKRARDFSIDKIAKEYEQLF